MYAYANITKFLVDTKVPTEEAERILAATRRYVDESKPEDAWLVSGAVPGKVMSSEMARRFHKAVMGDMEHLQIGFEAMQKG